jgi:hypothetical protein
MKKIIAFNLLKWKLIAGILVMLFVAYQVGKHFSKPKPANKNIISINDPEPEKENEPETKPKKEPEPQIKEEIKQKNT